MVLVGFFIYKNQADADVATSGRAVVKGVSEVLKVKATQGIVVGTSSKSISLQVTSGSVRNSETLNVATSGATINYIAAGVKKTANLRKFIQTYGLVNGSEYLASGTARYTNGVITSFSLSTLNYLGSMPGPAPSVTPSPTQSLTQGITFKQQRGYPRGNYEQVNSTELVSGEVAAFTATWPVIQGVFGTAPELEDPSLGTIKMTGSGPDGVGFEVYISGRDGETNIKISRGSDIGRLPIKFTTDPSSSIVLLESTVDRIFYRDNSELIKVGSQVNVTANWSNDGIAGETPVSSNSAVAEIQVTGSGSNGVGVKVTARSVGTAMITFRHGSDTAIYTVNVTN